MSKSGDILGDTGLNSRRNRLFLLGMAVMTDGLKALAGSALRAVLAKAAATSVQRHVLGRDHHAPRAVVQRHDHDHHRTGQRRAADIPARLEPGLRREHRHDRDGMAGGAVGRQGFSYGVRRCRSSSSARCSSWWDEGRWAGAGGAIAGFALILVGLTTLQQGMGGLAEQLNPADLPAVLGGAGVPWWSGIWACWCWL